MKQFYIIWILLALFIISCEDKDDDQEVIFPQALQEKIDELRAQESMCEICAVEVIEFDDETYYNLSCLTWSCMYCSLYHKDGSKVDFGQEDLDGFVESHKVIRTISICQD